MAIFGRTLLIGEDHMFIVNKRISFAIVSGNDRGVGRIEYGWVGYSSW